MHFVDQYFPGMASTDPEPEDKEAFIQAQLYDYHYKSALPSSYVWPKL
jgi:malate dehydrogenase (oxaloacetate-decarboxylating)(NADP+)